MGAGDGGPAGLDSSYDALLQCGLHAMAKTPKAIMTHTEWELNGKRIGEIGMSALIAGYHGVPFVFISGDRAATDEARDLVPDVEVAVVKEALISKVTGLPQVPAISLSPGKAQQVIREGARKAMGKIKQIQPLRFKPPYRLRWQFEKSRFADDLLAARPEAIRIDPVTLEFKTDDFLKLPL
jgi:D-amino peptidase